MKVIIVTGVSGSGKTTVGKLLSQRLGVPFFDADEFHSDENIEKMAAGIPLDDNDRFPWLERLSVEMVKWTEEGGAVLACSALKEKYRHKLTHGQLDSVVWVYLKAEFDKIKIRLDNRENHFFKPELLASQFADLEEPQYGISVSIDQSPNDVVDQILKSLIDTVN